jgi:DNA processing protein
MGQNARNRRPCLTEGARMHPPRELTGESLPPRLLDLPDPPARLYLRGDLPRGPAVAIVGTRRASAAGLNFTRGFAAELAAAGVAILSGGAEGIDTAAHEGALEAGGVTVVVTAAGFEHPFPAKNAALFARVLEAGGAYLSLFADEVRAKRPAFFARNACLVALAHAVVVTQAPFVSGAANAAKWARRLGRPVFIVPHSPWVREGSGAVQELRRGGRPLDRPREVLKFLRETGLHALAAPVQRELFPAPKLPAALDPVLVALGDGASDLDEIAARTGLDSATVQQRILTLALGGVLVPGPLGSLKLVTD